MKPIIPEKGKQQSHTDQSYVPKQRRIDCSKTKRQSKINKSKVINGMQSPSLKIKISGVKSCVLIRMCTFLSFLVQKISIMQNSLKFKVAFLLCLTRLIRLTLWFITETKKKHWWQSKTKWAYSPWCAVSPMTPRCPAKHHSYHHFFWRARISFSFSVYAVDISDDDVFFTWCKLKTAVRWLCNQNHLTGRSKRRLQNITCSTCYLKA